MQKKEKKKIEENDQGELLSNASNVDKSVI
jgi:hypothetical protein